jgi:hypothetical protein
MGDDELPGAESRAQRAPLPRTHHATASRVIKGEVSGDGVRNAGRHPTGCQTQRLTKSHVHTVQTSEGD